MTEFTFSLLIVCIPGVIVYFTFYKLVGGSPKGSLDTILLVFLFSILSYSLLDVFVAEDIITTIIFRLQYLDTKYILYSSLIGIFISYILAYGYTKKVFNKLGQKLSVTNRYGDEDVWDYFHNATINGKDYGWVIVRDHKYDFFYYGYISVRSDSEKQRELIISQVSVYDNISGNLLYKTEHLYISRNSDDLTIEIPTINSEGENVESRFKKNPD